MAERRFTFVFTAAVATAAAATFGVWRVLDNTRKESRVITRPVVVAARDLAEGVPIDSTAVVVKQWPAAAVPANAFGTRDSIVGRVTRVAVFTGEPIVVGRLAPQGTGAGLEVKIGPGKRAMGVRINDVAGISGLIQPNSRVDVLVTLREESGNRQMAKLFMENMRVLSVGTQVEPGADGKPINATTATLEVTPQEAERLAVAANTGSIQLVLRGYGDPTNVATNGAAASDVMVALGAARPPATPAPAAPRPTPRPRERVVVVSRPAAAPPAAVPAPPRGPDTVTVNVYRGEKVSQQKFAKSDSVKTP